MRKTWKQMIAMVSAAAMVVTGVNLPEMNVYAAEYSAIVSESGYKKATIKEAETGCGWSEGNVTTLFDGDLTTHWHSNYGNSAYEIGNTMTSDRNWVSVTLEDASDISGVVYVPRQHQNGTNVNGVFRTFKVMVSATEDGDDWKNVDIAKINGNSVETSAYGEEGNDAYDDGYYVNISNDQYSENQYSAVSGAAGGLELIFKDVQNDVQRVKFVAKETETGNAFMSAAELCVLQADKYVSDEIMGDNAVANSYMGNGSNLAYGTDGSMKEAFNDDTSQWHSCYTDGSYPSNSGYQNGVSGVVSEENKIYMATGFDAAKYISGFYCQSRTAERIKKCVISIANLSDATTKLSDPTLPDSEEVKISVDVDSVTWTDIYTYEENAQTSTSDVLNIEFERPVLATHMKLTVSSTAGTYVVVKRIKVSEVDPLFALKKRIDMVEEANSDGSYTDVLNAAKVLYSSGTSDVAAIDEQVQALDEIIDTVPVQGITLDKNELNLRYHEDFLHQAVLKAIVTPSYANAEVTWNSTNTDVATVDANGEVTAVGVGNATITATSSENQEITASCNVKVTAMKASQKNLAIGKETATNESSVSDLTKLNDENLGNYIDLGTRSEGKYVQIDLGESCDVDAVRLYRYYTDGRKYHATVVALAETTEAFDDGTATVIWNSDFDNVHGFGKGTDKEYSETSEGYEFVADETVSARYVRVYMYGSTSNTSDHIIELQVFGNEKNVLAGSDLTLNGMISLNIYAQVTEDDVENAVLKTVFNNETKECDVAGLDKKTVNGNEYYVLTQEVCAAQMKDDIDITLLVDGVEVDHKTHSVAAYAETVVKAGADTYGENLVNLAKAMVNYGAYAQTNFTYNVSNLANSFLTDADKAVVEAVTYENIKSAAPTASRDQINGKNPVEQLKLTLESGTSLKFYLNNECFADGIDGYSFTIGKSGVTAKDVSVVQQGSDMYVEYADIPAAELDDSYVLTITKDGVSATVTYSPMNGAASAVKSDSCSENLKNVMRALYLYNAAANVYFSAN